MLTDLVVHNMSSLIAPMADKRVSYDHYVGNTAVKLSGFGCMSFRLARGLSHQLSMVTQGGSYLMTTSSEWMDSLRVGYHCHDCSFDCHCYQLVCGPF